MKDPNKVLLPSCNLVLIALRVNESGGCIPFTLLDNLPLNLGHCSAIESIGKRITRRTHCSPDSLSQIPNRIEDGLVEFVH